MDNSVWTLCMPTIILCAEKDAREKTEKNNRICQGESALMSPCDLLHSYAQQPSTKGIHSTFGLFGQIHFTSLTNKLKF